MCPSQYRTGVTPDISPWLQFTFWQPILYLDSEDSWPSSKERVGYWLGIADNIRDFLTFWIMDTQTKQVLARSVIRPYNQNARVHWDPDLQRPQSHDTAQLGGVIKPSKEFLNTKLRNIQDGHDPSEHPSNYLDPKLPTFTPAV